MMNNVIEISGRQVVRDLESGISRYKHEDAGWGSIEEKYGMTPKEVEVFFRHPKIRDILTIKPRFFLVDDFDLAVDTELFEEPIPQLRPDFDQMTKTRQLVAEEKILTPAIVSGPGLIPDYMNAL